MSSTWLRRSKHIHITMHSIQAILLGERNQPQTVTRFKYYADNKSLYSRSPFMFKYFPKFQRPCLCSLCRLTLRRDVTPANPQGKGGIAVHCDSLGDQQPPSCWEITKGIISTRSLLTILSWELFTDQQTEPLHSHKSQARPSPIGHVVMR